MIKTLKLVLGLVTLLIIITPKLDAQNRPASPPGHAAAQVGGEWEEIDGRHRYVDGKWIEVIYNRPILRHRENIFGSGDDYGKRLKGGAPVWRLGANQSTRLKTEVGLKFGDNVVPPGEYSLFVDLREGDWTLIVSNWASQERYSPDDKEALWGSYGYTPGKDVARAAMQTSTLDYSVDQLTIGFSDVGKTNGFLYVTWGKTVARVPFTVFFQGVETEEQGPEREAGEEEAEHVTEQLGEEEKLQYEIDMAISGARELLRTEFGELKVFKDATGTEFHTEESVSSGFYKVAIHMIEAIPSPKAIALRDYIEIEIGETTALLEVKVLEAEVAVFSQARVESRHLPTQTGAAEVRFATADSDQFITRESVVQALNQLLKLFRDLQNVKEDPIITLCVRTDPSKAEFYLRPISSTVGATRISTTALLDGVYRGIYRYEIKKTGFKPSVFDDLNLVHSMGDMLKCHLVKGNSHDAPTPCQVLERSGPCR